MTEAGLLAREDWSEPFVALPSEPEATTPRPAYLMRNEFTTPADIKHARIHATAHGVYELELNGERVGDALLSPGWTSYRDRLRYQTYDVTEQLRTGRNALGVWVADGWYRGRLGFNGGRWNVYGDDLAILLQLEVTLRDGTVERIPLASSWRYEKSPITSVGFYEGEHFDARLLAAGWSSPGFDDAGWKTPVAVPIAEFPAAIEAQAAPPVRVIEQLKPVSVERRPNGRIRLDFGQNCSARLRLRVTAPRGHEIRLHHAEVLEDDELAIRPLRSAVSVDSYTSAGSGTEEWSPRFTFHGFRYAELENWPGEYASGDVVAEVLHSDMTRTGWFDSSNELLNKLHENTVWGMRSNFVDLPMDCPQRDERLGWTGDIQVFAPAALFLYDSTEVLADWLRDLAVEQENMGWVPNFVPWVECGFPEPPSAAWGDAAVIVPWVIYERTGNPEVLREQFASMCAWVDLVEQLSDGTGLWNKGFQLGDWLDPTAPPEDPGDAKTDKYLVATAYFSRSAQLLAKAARVLGEMDAAARYEAIHAKARAAFRREYVSSAGRVVSDTPTALSLALVFDLLEPGEQRERAGKRLIELTLDGDHRIQTGFVGTPIICDALVQAGAIDTAYHLLLQTGMPSWLYAVTMGATTVWERWDSMLPNGQVNPGEMTSFNHYALGAVVDFLHRVVAGLAPASPGYERILVAPRPGGGLEHARAAHLTPFGHAEVSWRRQGEVLTVDVEVPKGTSAIVDLPGLTSAEIGPGRHTFTTRYRAAVDDPAAPVLINPHRPEPDLQEV